MAKFCRKCEGSGWYGPRTMYGGSWGGPCRACDGTGYDQRWGETSCKGCGTTIDYRYDWSNIPEYCQDCKQWHEKSCANPHCRGTIRYKAYWDNIHDYCKDCKGWYEKPCENPQCNGTIKAHCEWSNPPKYCSCKGWNEKPCKGSCGGNVRYHCEWDRPPDYCKGCDSEYRKAKEDFYNKVSTTKTGRHDSLPGSSRTPADLGCDGATVTTFADSHQHVTVWSNDGTRYSWDVDSEGSYAENLSTHYSDKASFFLRGRYSGGRWRPG